MSGLPARIDDTIDIVGFGLGHRNVLTPQYRTLVIIQLVKAPPELELGWLVQAMGGPEQLAAKQLLDAALVIATDPNARLTKIIKNEAIAGEYLITHTAIIG
jgi:hypothetical protein